MGAKNPNTKRTLHRAQKDHPNLLLFFKLPLQPNTYSFGQGKIGENKYEIKSGHRIEQRRLLSAFCWTSLSLIGANDSDNSGTGFSLVCFVYPGRPRALRRDTDRLQSLP